MAAIVVVATCLGGVLALARPHYNWDLLPYLGLAYRFAGVSEAHLHEAVYSAAREAVPQESMTLLESGDSYRSTAAASPDSFREQLAFYSVKPAYPILVSLTMRAGVQSVRAAVFVTQLGYVAIGVALLYWFLLYLPPIRSALATSAMLAFPPVVELSRLSTPDSVSTALVVLGLAVLFRGRRSIGQAILVSAILVRPDNILWLLGFSAYSALFETRHLKQDVGVLLIAAVVAAAIVWVSDAYSWGVLIQHKFFGKLAYPSGYEPDFTLWELVRLYVWASHPVRFPAVAMLAGIIAVAVLWARAPKQRWEGPVGQLLVVSVCYMVFHWALIPSEERFFVPAYLSIGVAVVLWGREIADPSRSAT